MLSPLADVRFFTSAARAAVLAVTLTGCFGAAGFVIDAPQCCLTFDRHYKSSGGLIATKQ